MIKRTVRAFIQILGGLGAGLTIVLILATWRLSAGPISLAFLSPYLETALSSETDLYKIRLDDTILTWAGWGRTLDIRVLNVRAIGPGGTVVASVPEASVSLSARALMRGVVAPQRIEIFRPRLRLTRHRDGSFEVGFGDTAQNSARNLGTIIENALTTHDPAEAASYLTQVDIWDADISLIDQTLRKSWRAPSSRISLERDITGIKGEVSLRLDVDGQQAEITVLGGYTSAGGRLDLGINFTGIRPAVFAGLSEGLAMLGAVDLPLQGTVTVSMVRGGGVEGVDFDLTGGAGTIGLPAPMEQQLAVEKLTVRGRFEGAGRRLEIDDLAVELGEGGTFFLPKPTDHAVPLRAIRARGRYLGGEGRLEIVSFDADLAGPSISLQGTVEGIGGTLSAAFEATGKDLPMDEFRRYWPRAWGTAAYEWTVPNLTMGIIRRARASIRLGADGADGFDVLSLDGEMEIENATLDYLEGMPKVHRLNGSATFNRQRMDITVTSGESVGLRLREGMIHLTALDQVDQFADIDLVIDGPFRSAMELIDHEPLRFASAMSIDPATTGGEQTTWLKMHFLMERGITMEQVETSATSDIRDATIANIILGEDISEGQLRLTGDKTGMDVKGNIRLGVTPISLSWRRNFSDHALFRDRYDLAGHIADVRTLGDKGVPVDFLPPQALSGSAQAEIRYTVVDDRKSRLEARIDLTDVVLSFPIVDWSKDAGVAGMLELDLAIRDGRPAGTSSFSVAAGDLSGTGKIQFAAAGGRLEKIDLDQIAFGRTDMKGVLVAGQDGGWTASFHGASFNLQPLFENFLKSTTSDPGVVDESDLKLSLSLDLDQVWLGPDRGLRNVTGTLVRDGVRWRTIRMEADVGKGKPLSIRLQPLGKQRRRLIIRAADAGDTLRAFDFYGNIIGGTLEIVGIYDDAAPGSPVSGRVRMQDYRVVKAPAMARVVSILALTGIVEALQGEGLAFSVLDGKYTLDRGLLTLDDVRASGVSLGYTAKGKIYTHADMVDVEGTVVPAYGLNSILGKIPVLGTLLTGGEEGGGVFAATYKVTGPMEKPEITVNPLSLFAPGVLRNMFGKFKGAEETSGAPMRDDPSVVDQ